MQNVCLCLDGDLPSIGSHVWKRSGKDYIIRTLYNVHVNVSVTWIKSNHKITFPRTNFLPIKIVPLTIISSRLFLENYFGTNSEIFFPTTKFFKCKRTSCFLLHSFIKLYILDFSTSKFQYRNYLGS